MFRSIRFETRLDQTLSFVEKGRRVITLRPVCRGDVVSPRFFFRLGLIYRHPDLYISTTSVNGIQDDAQLQSKVSTHVVGSDSMGGKTSLDPE